MTEEISEEKKYQAEKINANLAKICFVLPN
jgi:hypothetical protein